MSKNPSVYVQNRFALEPLGKEERVKLISMPLREIEPGDSPYRHDMMSSGVVMVNDWQALFHSNRPNDHLDLYNTTTGQAFRIHITPEVAWVRSVIDLCLYGAFRNEALYVTEISDHLVVAFHDAMLHQVATGTKIPFEQQYVCIEGRVLVNCGFLQTATVEQIQERLEEFIFGELQVAVIIARIADLRAYIDRRGSEMPNDDDLTEWKSKDGANV